MPEETESKNHHERNHTLRRTLLTLYLLGTFARTHVYLARAIIHQGYYMGIDRIEAVTEEDRPPPKVGPPMHPSLRTTDTSSSVYAARVVTVPCSSNLIYRPP